jgi:3-oxoacyl-[acyl-carrier-protein] synthase-3
MIGAKSYTVGFEIGNVGSCDFSKLTPVKNKDILKLARDGAVDERLITFLGKKMGIETRYHCPKNINSMDISRDAIKDLIAKEPSIVEEAEFFILAGISNPMPSVCTSALLAGEFGFKNVSCWDIKSGCSTGVLGAMQALDWFNLGAKKGVLICTETLTKFTNPEALQMSASTGDGAVAVSLHASSDWEVLGTIHGTDAEYLKAMYVPGTYPVEKDFNPMDYVFAFDAKADTLEKMGYYWQKSLSDLLDMSGLKGEDVDHYIAHQVDGKKNFAFAKSAGIKDENIALNFKDFGNMGCPTIYFNYKNWVENSGRDFKSGETLVLHAVGGGISWAGIALRKK